MWDITRIYAFGFALSTLKTDPITNDPVFPAPFLAYAIKSLNGSYMIKGIETV